MKNILRFLFILLIALSSSLTFAQEETEKKVEKPVRDPFEASTLIENQTIIGVDKGQIEMIIHHRMGSTNNGFTDLFGLYAASNIRLGLQYGVIDKLTVGLGTEKDNKYTDLNAKYELLRQTRSGSMPVSLSLFGNISLDSKDEEFFGADYAYTDRLSYFGQILVARKFMDALTIQVAPSYSHFNSVLEGYKNDMIGIMAGGRYKFYGNMSAVVEYNHPITINAFHDDDAEIQPGISAGLQVATATHAFQIFATNYKGISAQNNYVMNTRKFDSEGILIGFNITVTFN